MTILAMTPIEDEFKALTSALAALGLRGQERAAGRIAGLAYNSSVSLPNRESGLFVAQGGLGKAQFGVHAQHLLDHLDGVKLLVCAGTAGSLVKGLAIADVVAATATVEHDFGTVLMPKPPPSFEGHAGYLRLLDEMARNLEGSGESVGDGFKVHFGPVASGDEGIADDERARQIQQATGALAVAWEGAGGARAARFSGVPYLELRAITDGANPDAFTDFFQNIPVAMRSIAAVLRWLMANPLDVSQRAQRLP
ncbi:MAG: 5'-methylthioadenosine/S-adenosylhomocysteine nucleosidase [Chloroflexi bacterium]|nr:5'-methylthioadenosine/S-adenosylhomocysteine nucleosidase [Chloroflexota bacterium]